MKYLFRFHRHWIAMAKEENETIYVIFFPSPSTNFIITVEWRPRKVETHENPTSVPAISYAHILLFRISPFVKRHNPRNVLKKKSFSFHKASLVSVVLCCVVWGTKKHLNTNYVSLITRDMSEDGKRKVKHPKTEKLFCFSSAALAETRIWRLSFVISGD